MLVSSHLMSEMELTADHLVVLGRGRLVVDAPLAKVIAGSSLSAVLVRSPHAGDLATLLTAAGLRGVERTGGERPRRQRRHHRAVGDLAFDAGVRLHELSTREASLEQAYQELTAGSVEYRAAAR